MQSYFIARRCKAVLGFIVGVSALTATAAQAGTITYPNINGLGFTVSNISESNDLPGNVALYGAPSLTPDGHSLTFNASAYPFTVNAANGSSSFLRGVLNFTVTFINPPSNTPNIGVAEQGTFSGVGDAYATVSPYLFLFDSNSNPLGSVTGTITPTDPFLGGPGNTKSAFTWQGTANVSNGNPIHTFNVILDNDLSAISQSPGSSVQIDKKFVKIDVCLDCTGDVPEPASLGLLGLGGLAMLIRRRK